MSLILSTQEYWSIICLIDISSQEERKEFGGSLFIEIPFCKMPQTTKTKKIAAVDSIENRQNDSLYISDENTFFQEYSNIFDCGIYNNLKSGQSTYLE